MKYYYICLDCIKTQTGKSAYDLPVEVFNELRAKLTFSSKSKEPICPVCGSKNIVKSLGMETSYVRGYGYSDKAGVKNDMDMHVMATGSDPYKEHRQTGETDEVVRKLKKAREFDAKPKTVHLS